MPETQTKKRRRVLVLSTWLRPPMATGLSRFARQANWHLHLESMISGGPPHSLACDGMLVFHSERADLNALARKQASRCPTVLVSGMQPIVDVPRVMEDNVAVGRMAAEHFLKRGFHHFAWLSNDHRRVSQDRRTGYLTALQEAGMSCQCIESPGGQRRSWREYHRWAAKHLEAMPRPFALFALDDAVAVDLIEICRDCGLRIPEDAAVLGVGNDALICEFSGVPLSSIELNWEDIIYRASELLHQLMEGGEAPDAPLVFSPRRVVERASSDILAVPDVHLVNALQYVRDHFREPITVRDVAQAVGVTRRTLENHFRRRLHMGLAEEIRRRRLNFAQDLLLQSDLSIAEIARQTGFDNGVCLAKFFKRELGIQPSRFREQARREPGERQEPSK